MYEKFAQDIRDKNIKIDTLEFISYLHQAIKPMAFATSKQQTFQLPIPHPNSNSRKCLVVSRWSLMGLSASVTRWLIRNSVELIKSGQPYLRCHIRVQAMKRSIYARFPKVRFLLPRLFSRVSPLCLISSVGNSNDFFNVIL